MLFWILAGAFGFVMIHREFYEDYGQMTSKECSMLLTLSAATGPVFLLIAILYTRFETIKKIIQDLRTPLSVFF